MVSVASSVQHITYLIDFLGIGKSTLLRHIAMREVPIPAHITILFVEQEVFPVPSVQMPCIDCF